MSEENEVQEPDNIPPQFDKMLDDAIWAHNRLCRSERRPEDYLIYKIISSLKSRSGGNQFFLSGYRSPDAGVIIIYYDDYPEWKYKIITTDDRLAEFSIPIIRKWVDDMAEYQAETKRLDEERRKEYEQI